MCRRQQIETKTAGKKDRIFAIFSNLFVYPCKEFTPELEPSRVLTDQRSKLFFSRPFRSKIVYGLIFLMLCAGLTSCDSVMPEAPFSPELMITTVTVTMTELNDEGNPTNTAFRASFRDLDGLGGDLPHVNGLVVRECERYESTLMLLDERHDEPIDISNIIRADADQYQVFYSLIFAGEVFDLIDFNVVDVDADNLPLGLRFFADVEHYALTPG